jgi:hypothetical protein
MYFVSHSSSKLYMAVVIRRTFSYFIIFNRSRTFIALNSEHFSCTLH